MQLDRPGFRTALRSGLCDPPRRFTPLVSCCRRTFHRLELLQKKTVHDHYDAAKKRMQPKPYAQMRVAAEHSLRCADDYFPAYHFHAGELVNDEWLSSVDWHKPFHRDHISHQLMSVYTGRAILHGGPAGEFVFDERPLIDWCMEAVLRSPECEYLREYLRAMGAGPQYFDGSTYAKALWTRVFLESFFTAATYHDIGYPWQFVNTLHSQLRNHSPDESPFGQGIEGIYDHYRHRLAMYPFNGYQPCSATQPAEWSSRCLAALEIGYLDSHGVPGAFAFLYLNDLMRRYPSTPRRGAVSRFCIEWAAMAILMHDMQKLYAAAGDRGRPDLRLSLTRDPLSFVLTLVDQIQDFGRPNAKFSSGRHGRGVIDVSYVSQCCRVEINRRRRGRVLEIMYVYSDAGAARENQLKHKPKAYREYFEPQAGYLDYRALPLDQIRLDARHDPSAPWWP